MVSGPNSFAALAAAGCMLLLNIACCLSSAGAHDSLLQPVDVVAANDDNENNDPNWARAEDLVKKMTFDEKLQFVQGTKQVPPADEGYVGVVLGVPRLGIPDLLMNDGPQGFRAVGHDGTSTQWPSGLTVARSWNRSLAGEWGKAIGREFHGKGANVYFGPGLNVARVLNGGRSFEYLSGEDPFLGHELVGPVIEGVQAQKVVANAKHYLDNNQEGFIPPNATKMKFGYGDRHSSSMNVAERTQMEIYFPPFLGAVNAGVGSFMCANNLVNGVYACQNDEIQNGYLRNWSGFKGFICSDYDGTRSTYEAAAGGLDIAMPGPPTRPDYFGSFLRDALNNHTIEQAVVDEKVTRVVYAMIASGALDDPPDPQHRNAAIDVTSRAHQALARRLAAESTVLLKNARETLPLRVDATLRTRASGDLYRVAVIGAAGDGPGAIYGGGGSGQVVPKDPVSIRRALANDNRLNVTFLDGTGPASEVSALAAAADVAIVVLAQTSTEGHDRDTLELPQSDIVAAVAKNDANTPVVVVAVTPGPFLVEKFIDISAAVLDMGFPGEQEGNAIADILLGRINPSGKMPHTTPRKWNDMEMNQAQYPGTPPANSSKTPPACQDTPTATAHFSACVPTETAYSEALEVGYRFYDARGQEPRFCFGHGLSYTTFGYENLTVDSQQRAIHFTLSNTGNVAGAEVAQLYLRFPSTAGEPFRQLRGFEKVFLEPGQHQDISFSLESRWLSMWNETEHGWNLAVGDHDVFLGSSLNDIRLTGTLSV